MTNPKITRRQIIKGAAAVGALGAVGLPSVAFAEGDEGGGRIRWDLIDITPPSGSTKGEINAGGDDTASSEGEFTLTLTGSGTFRPGHSHQVTGGGTWSSNNPTVGGSGTYRVTELVSWVLAPGGLPPIFNDHIGKLADLRAGLAVLRIKYSDGLDGTLVVSCNLAGTPSSVDEGVNGSRGFVNFFMPAPPGFGKHANRTAFHALHEEE
jgi:hypothetical protein